MTFATCKHLPTSQRQNDMFWMEMYMFFPGIIYEKGLLDPGALKSNIQTNKYSQTIRITPTERVLVLPNT